MPNKTLMFTEDSFPAGIDAAPTLSECIRILGVHPDRPETFPYVNSDVTAGMENELQVAVSGNRETVDLPQTIEHSCYYANIKLRVRRGDTPHSSLRGLERYLAENPEGVWENSWVRFLHNRLNDNSQRVLHLDFKADKSNPDSPPRSDISRFSSLENGEQWLRLPISYLLKLSLADVIGRGGGHPIITTGARLLDNFLSDNTSPETLSFHVVHSPPQNGVGAGVAREAAKRFLLCNLLLDYANIKFGLKENGQRALLFFSPHPPIRQRLLNESISDAFYRELFMSPCLSGWDKGESKHAYMALCHQVLSRSHINAVMKMREASIITKNLVVLPHTSNVGLANNGTHISLGSKRMTMLNSNPVTGFSRHHEKYLGDLNAKIMEHFLPLFVGTYSAAPYRFDYEDFHPEKALGFLPHQLDYTHLRMIWRRWKKKAKNKVFGHALTPFGPHDLDRFIRSAFSLKGDFVPDFRLLDYPVALLATEGNCCQDGRLGNDYSLKKDLETLGVFDKRMSLYQLIKLREFTEMGFSGFEFRHYSLFHDFGDMKEAANLQMLLAALAFKYIISGRISHDDIPSTPFIESERRQILFGAAIGIPTFFVLKKTRNIFLKQILQRVKGSRVSRRYSDYFRVHNSEYRLALLEILRKDGSDLIEIMGMDETMRDLEERLKHPTEKSAWSKLVCGILGSDAAKIKPHDLSAHEFNSAAERYYRERLRIRHLEEGWRYLADDIKAMAHGRLPLTLEQRDEIKKFCAGRPLEEAIAHNGRQVSDGKVDEDGAVNFIRLFLLAETFDSKRR